MASTKPVAINLLTAARRFRYRHVSSHPSVSKQHLRAFL